MAALVDLSRNKTTIQRQEILDILQVTALSLPLFGGGLHVCICAYVVVRVSLMFVHMCVAKVMFEVYGDESMSDQYGSFCVCF